MSSIYRLSVIIPFVLLLISGCSQNKKETPATQVKHLDPYSAPLYPANEISKAKNFEVELRDHQTFKLSDQLGNVVLMNIWASWCVPCLDETPDLVSLYNTYKSDGFVVLGVSIDEQGESVVQPFIDKFDISYPVYIDSEDVIMDKYGPTMGIPTTYIIDKSGNLRYFAVGAVTRKELEPRILSLLSE